MCGESAVSTQRTAGDLALVQAREGGSGPEETFLGNWAQGLIYTHNTARPITSGNILLWPYPRGTWDSYKLWSLSRRCSFPVIQSQASGFSTAWHIIWGSKYVCFLPQVPASSSFWDRVVSSRIGRERSWPQETLSWILGVWLMLHQGCKAAGWQYGAFTHFQVHSGPVSLLLRVRLL